MGAPFCFFFRVLKFFLAAEVAMFPNEAPGLGEVGLGGYPRIEGFAEEEPRPVQMDVRPVQRHWASLGYF